MINLDKYIERIKTAKNPIKETLILVSLTSEELLNALLSRAIELSDIETAQVIFVSMKINSMHNFSLFQIEEENSRVLK